MLTANRYLAHFNTQSCGKCPYGREHIPDGIRDDRCVTGNHHDGHGLTDCPADTKDNCCGDTGKGCRDNDPADGLPPCRPDCKRAFPELPGNRTDGILRHADNGWQGHDAKEDRGSKPGLTGRDSKSYTDEVGQHNQAKEPVDHGGDTREEFDQPA